MKIDFSTINLNSINFAKRKINNQNVVVPQGVDYSSLDNLDRKRTKRIDEISIANYNGDNITVDRDRLILSRIKSALRDARKFCDEYPQFNYDDICQDLIIIIIENTNKQIEEYTNNYGQMYARKRDNYFEKLLSKQNDDVEYRDDLILPQNDHDLYDECFVKGSLNEAMESLKPKEREILENRFGIFGERKTLGETGKIFNLGAERIRVIEAHALHRLRILNGRMDNALKDELKEYAVT